jgi:glutathione synthase/RimK-type ligase-like ATP-grasp enzyme
LSDAKIIRGHQELMRRYAELKPGDVFIGKIGAKPIRQALLIDCQARGIRCFPSALAQCLHHSKTAQAFVLKEFMLPLTRVISRRNDLLTAATEYGKAGIGAVVTKQNQMHCGHGVRKWDSAEMLYNLLGFETEAFPFVLQPFLPEFTDVRAIVAGQYREAYARSNPGGFRKNLAAGGSSVPYDLSSEQVAFCRRVMDRAGFPFAHIDLHVTSDGKIYLSEIALNGGLKGAAVGRPELDQIKQEILELLARGA